MHAIAEISRIFPCRRSFDDWALPFRPAPQGSFRLNQPRARVQSAHRGSLAVYAVRYSGHSADTGHRLAHADLESIVILLPVKSQSSLCCTRGCGGARLATLREMGDCFVSAWKRAEVGKVFEERHLTFFTSEELTAAFTPKRRELLRRLHGKARKPVAMFKKRNAC